MTTEGSNAWNFRDRPGMDIEGRNLVGFEVHATDGHIGKIDEATTEVDKSRIVVDTGPWIFGRKVLLPAGLIEDIDWDDEKVYVDRTKDEIKDSPKLEGSSADPSHSEQVAAYYDKLDTGHSNPTGPGQPIPPS